MTFSSFVKFLFIYSCAESLLQHMGPLLLLYRLSLVVASRGCSLVAVFRFLTAVASLVADYGFQGSQAQYLDAQA